MKGRTSVIIAHHLGTIRHADVIFVVKDSELVETGTHDELLAKGGVYAELYRIQMGERNLKEPEPSLLGDGAERRPGLFVVRIARAFRAHEELRHGMNLPRRHARRLVVGARFRIRLVPRV